MNETLLTLIEINIDEYKRKCEENNVLPTMFSTPNSETRKQLFYSTLEDQNRISWSQLEKVVEEMTMLDVLRLENIWFKEDEIADTSTEIPSNSKEVSKEVCVIMDLSKITARTIHLHNM